MRLLALETSLRSATLAALSADGEEVSVAGSKTLPTDQRSAQALLPAVHDLLVSCGWKVADLDLIVVTTGPGSFTGLRIGVTVAKTLAYAAGTELVGVSSLAAIAAGVAPTDAPIWAIIDAQRQELFAARFSVAGQHESQTPSETSVITIDDWLKQLTPGDVVCGPPLSRLADQLPTDVKIARADQWQPRAEIVGQLGLAAHRQGETVDPMQMVPQYFRRSAAEEKADGAQE